MKTIRKTSSTQRRRQVLELLVAHGVVNSRGVGALVEGWTAKRAWDVLTAGVKAGLWSECPCAPGTYRITPLGKASRATATNHAHQ